ncbi:MAG: hypothetical protein ABSB14_02250 [Candidatus Sulfotelmatobacter sp.]|jgi:hypothetical protein
MSANYCRLRILTTTASLVQGKTTIRQSIALTSTLLLGISSLAQQTQPTTPESGSQNTSESAAASAKPAPVGAVTVPAGTSIALVLTHPIQSRYIHHGDDIYAQVISAVTAGNQVVIPPGTLVQGKVQKLGHNGSRGEVRLQSLSIIYPDGYVATVAGPITLESDQGYALKDPGNGRVAGLIAGPLVGSGVGALIGHSVAPSQGTTLTSSIPPGCTPGSFGCLSSSVTGPPEKGKDTVIGAAVGGGIGLAVGLVLVGTSHHFFLDVGAPVEMVLPHALTLQGDQVADALSDAEQHPATVQAIAKRPQPPPPPPDMSPPPLPAVPPNQ